MGSSGSVGSTTKSQTIIYLIPQISKILFPKQSNSLRHTGLTRHATNQESVFDQYNQCQKLTMNRT
jgi:hypothetical protein